MALVIPLELDDSQVDKVFKDIASKSDIKLLFDFKDLKAKAVGIQKSFKDIGEKARKNFEDELKRARMKEIGAEIGGNLRSGLQKSFVGIGGLFTAALSASVDVKGAQGRLAAITGADPKLAKELGEIQSELFVNAYGEGLEGAGQVTADAFRALNNQNEIEFQLADVENLAVDFANLQETFEIEGQLLSDATRNALANGLAGSGEEVADILTRGLQLDPSGEFVESLKEYSTELKQLGIDAEEFLAISTAGVGEGAFNINLVADLLKESGIKLQESSKETTKAFTAVGLDGDAVNANIAKGGEDANKAYNQVLAALLSVDDAAKRNELSVALLGTQYEDLGPDVVKAMAEASKGVDGLSQASEELDKNINDNFGVALEQVRNKISKGLGDAFAPLATSLSASLENLDFSGLGTSLEGIDTDKLAQDFVSITQSFIELVPKALELAPVFIEIAGTVGDLILKLDEIGILGETAVVGLGIKTVGVKNSFDIAKGSVGLFKGQLDKVDFGKVTSSLKTFGSGALTMGGNLLSAIPSIKSMGLALKAFALNPVFLTIGAIVLAIGAVYLAFKNWDKIGPVVKNAFDAVIKFFTETIGGLPKKALEFGLEIGKKLGNGIKKIAIEGINAIIEAFNNITGKLKIPPIPTIKVPIEAEYTGFDAIPYAPGYAPSGANGAVASNAFGGNTNKRTLSWLSEFNHKEAILSEIASPQRNFNYIVQAGLEKSLAPFFQKDDSGGNVFNISVESSGKSSASQRLTGTTIGLAVDRTLRRRGLA